MFFKGKIFFGLEYIRLASFDNKLSQNVKKVLLS